MATHWYIQTGSGENGPYAVEVLAALAREGRLKPNTAVRSVTDWMAAGSVPGVFSPRPPISRDRPRDKSFIRSTPGWNGALWSAFGLLCGIFYPLGLFLSVKALVEEGVTGYAVFGVIVGTLGTCALLWLVLWVLSTPI